MKTRALFLAISMVSVAGLAQAQANLITNGGFESGVFSPPSNQTVTLPIGATSLSGWEVVNDSIAWIGVGNPWYLTAFEGNRFLDLSDYSAGVPFGGVRQSIATVAGAEYLLSFQLGSSNYWGRPSALVVTAGTTSASFTSPRTGTDNDWGLQTFSFRATGATTSISFVGNSGVNYIGLDDVKVTAAAVVPEPSEAALLLAGLAAVGWQLRRRARQV